ncbi:helix-turn-helix transcriptional regulator [Chryseobacterium sp. SN22]|uniref:helix-turn-helix domain-containing protein n=1 Tax=Chryseobacterium sp. SN22 TaxID=2606431 RepID=UPI0011F00379|nr:helix-turn-helix transcriptional regulator [Chryseobacterium sp. SN22]KAA0128277.1 helix-turn-helix transcriptional regulator [Chryseobacterium sp. SN22]
MEQKVHQGRNVKRFREMLGIKQETLAFDLDISQQKISLLEQKENIESDMLEKIAELMKIPVEAFQNFDEEQAINIISNTITNHEGSTGIAYNFHPTFNPIDKVIQLYDEKIALYERLLKEKDEMMLRLEKLLQNK